MPVCLSLHRQHVKVLLCAIPATGQRQVLRPPCHSSAMSQQQARHHHHHHHSPPTLLHRCAPCCRWVAALDEIEVALAAEGVRLVRWRSHAWAQPAFDSNYRSWKKQRGEMRPALPAPSCLPALLPDVEAGHMPCAATMARLLAAAATSGCDDVESQAAQAVQAAAEDPLAGVLARLLASGYSSQQLMQIYIE